MKINAWLCICSAILAQPLHANGGGYFRGGVERAGDVAGFEPKETEKIRIMDEKLTVVLGQKSADVEVRYLMRNETDKMVKVRFGFPVEESFDRDIGISGIAGIMRSPRRASRSRRNGRLRKRREMTNGSKASQDGWFRRSPLPRERKSR
jgi:hypothetical protein